MSNGNCTMRDTAEELREKIDKLARRELGISGVEAVIRLRRVIYSIREVIKEFEGSGRCVWERINIGAYLLAAKEREEVLSE